MKRTAILALAVLTLAFAGAAYADASQLIPSFHWTYRSLGGLAQSGLIDAGVTPGKSAYNPEQVASMVVMAVKRAERDITKLGAAELSELRRLAAAYKDAFEGAGYDYDAVRCDIEICAMRAGLPGEGSAESFSHSTQALVEDAALSINEFTFDLYKAATAGAAGENVFLSPYSVSTALAMTYAGARGVTEAEMARALHFPPDVHAGMGALIGSINAVPDSVATVRTANAIWPAKGEKLLPEFVQLVRRDYRAGLTQLDYAKRPESARKTINNWVEDQTAGKITDIIPGGALGKDEDGADERRLLQGGMAGRVQGRKHRGAPLLDHARRIRQRTDDEPPLEGAQLREARRRADDRDALQGRALLHARAAPRRGFIA